SYGVGEIVHDKAQEDVKQIIEESAKGTFKDGSNEQKIGDFYNAYMDMKARNEKGISPLTPELQKIDALKDYAQLSAYFGESITYGRRTPVTIGVVEDFKDPNKYMLYTWQYGLGLPEREYYFLNDAA